MRRVALIFYALIVCWPTFSAAQPLTILYQDRAPYYMVDQSGQVGGLVGTPIDQALRAAGIETDWQSAPPKRQLQRVKANMEPVCSPGWFKKPTRLVFAKFSLPVYRDKPQVIVIRQEDKTKFDHEALSDIFGDTSLVLGTKLGYSYGDVIDQMIEEKSPTVTRTPQDLKGMVRMLRGGRFDYFISTPEELQAFNATDTAPYQTLAQLTLSDAPPGNYRYLMCSQQVSDALIFRFNQALVDHGDALVE